MPLLMGSGSGDDLFRGFNEVEVSEVLRRCTNCGRFVLIGPPRSGKTFFREKYLEGRLGVGVTVNEHTLGTTTTTKAEGEEAKGELGLREKVMGLLKSMIPLIGKFRDKARVDVEELRRVLGDRAPKHIVEWAKGMIGDSPHRAYYIPWDSDEVRKCVEEPSACAFGADVGDALKLIKEAFGDKKRIKWFRADYIPPGLVKEVIELIREKGEDGARRVLEDWVDAYFKAIDTLSNVLGLKENLLEWDELSIGFLSNFVNNSANYVIGGLAAAPLIGAASLAIISVLTYMAFKKEGENYLKEIIELRESLERLLVKGPDGRLDFNELGKLLVYRVAYAMGMSYDEAKRALTDITGLSMEELERRVKEIEREIEELEKKIELFRQEVPAGIVTADVGEFAKGRIYPNIKVENGELRVRVEDGYHSIVRAGKFNELVNEVRDRLLKQGFAVVVGPKGIGKSTLAAAEIWKLFMNGDIGLVARVDVLDSENSSEFTTFIENYGEKLSKYFGRLLILYDPVSTKAYERADIDVKAHIQANIEMTVRNLMKVIKPISSEASKPLTLIVLPSDVYNALSEERRNELEGYRLDVSQGLINTEFLVELIREYTRTKSNPNGCALSDRELGELAGKVAGFDSGHALIARLIGEELARNNCSAREIEELLSKAKGKAEAFMILYINRLFKVQEDLDTVKALVEIFALRRPFVDLVRPGGPILTPGIIGLIGEERGAKTLYGAEGKELRSWLAHRQHDLIEEAIEKLLKCIVSGGEECKELGDALEPWKETIGVMGSLREVSEKVRDESTAVEYFVGNYGEKLANALKVFSNECWKRVALIIGYASAGIPIVSRPEDLFVLLPEDLRKSVVESLSDALKECGVDYYLLVGNEIPPLIKDLVIMDLAYKRALAEAFVDKYDEAVAEIERVLNIVRKRGIIDEAESFYGLGLASIIAAAWLDRNVNPSDADIALRMMSFAIHRVALPQLIKPVLDALEPLYDKAPQRYLEVLVSALDKASRPSILGFILGFMCPDFDTVRYILNEFDNILNKYRDRVKGHAWTLVRAIKVLINSLYNCLLNCDDYKDYWDAPFRTELERIASRVAGFLNEIDRLNPSLDIFAWAHASLTALKNKCVRALVESVLGVDVVNKKAKEIAGGLSGLRESVQELIRDKDFMDLIMEETSDLLYEWAHYKLDNDELYEAEELFNEATRERREIGDFQNYLDSSNWALRAKAIRSKLAGDELVELVNGFRQLYEEAKKQSDTLLLIDISDMLDDIFGGYLVSLALKGDDEEIRRIEELLEEQGQGPEGYWRAPILIRLTLSALLCTRGELSGELKGRLFVEPWELIEIHGSGYTGITSQGKLRRALIKYFRRWISKGEVLDLLKKLDLDAESLVNELRGWIHELSDELLLSLARFSFCSELYQRYCSSEHLAYMLYALINGNEKLAKAHALYGAVNFAGKLPARLYLEVYKECCDLKNELFRLALARLFFLHV